MTAADVPNQALYAAIAKQLDATDRTRHQLAERAFDQLRQTDPELAHLGLELMEKDDLTARLFASQPIGRFPNSYAALAAGQRDLIVGALIRTMYGMPG